MLARGGQTATGSRFRSEGKLGFVRTRDDSRWHMVSVRPRRTGAHRGAGAVGGRARVVARERRVILLLFVASVAFGRCERCDDVTCLLVVTRTKFVIVTFFYTVSS
jgi:hypothetical protein